MLKHSTNKRVKIARLHSGDDQQTGTFPTSKIVSDGRSNMTITTVAYCEGNLEDCELSTNVVVALAF